VQLEPVFFLNQFELYLTQFLRMQFHRKMAFAFQFPQGRTLENLFHNVMVRQDGACR
jgi:hypothetical protein